MSFLGFDVGQPNSTLYIQNLNERIALKHLVPQLRDLFLEYGDVVLVIAKRRLALRGQAFVAFKDVESARKALEAVQGNRIYGKSMVIKYAKYKSDFISKADGTYEIERRRREQDRIEKARAPRVTRRQLAAQMAANPMMAMQTMHGMMGNPMMPMGQLPVGVRGDIQLPNKVLYLQGLSETTKEVQLQEMFKRWPGFVEVRLVPNRPDLAFVEYENEMQAGAARQTLDGVEIDGSKLRVTFARK